MTTLSQQTRPARVSRRTGRPSATTNATIDANMDVIARDLTDEAILRNLLRDEKRAAVYCKCADAKLHEIDCKVAELIRERRHDIDLRKAENQSLSAIIVPDDEKGHRIVRALDAIVRSKESVPA